MLLPISVLRLRNPEFIGFTDGIITICKKYNLPLPAFATPVATFESGMEPIKDRYALEKGSPLSEELRKLDLRRDNAINGIKQNAESYNKHFMPAKVAAGDVVLRAIAKYGNNIAGQSFLQQTTILNKLSVDFEAAGPVKDALALLGLTDWAAEMKTANLAFETKFMERNTESSQKPEGSLTEMRVPGKLLWDNFVKIVHAHETLSPTADLDSMIKEMNTFIKKYNELIEKRAAKGADDPDSPDEDDDDLPTPV